MKQIILIIGLGGLLAAQYIGSYTARLSPQDHYSSRGAALRSAVEILQQDRANYYRFGRSDREDTGTGYFATRGRRAVLGRMLYRGMLSWDLDREILYGSPLVRVDIYSRHLEVHHASAADTRPSYTTARQSAPERNVPKRTLSSLLEEDARNQVVQYARNHRMGFSEHDLKHVPEGIYFAREGDQEIAWVVIASSPRKNFECHACVPVLSMLVYHKQDARTWKLTRSAYKAFQGGSGWDNPPGRENMALVHLSADKCALAIRTGYANMGWGMEYYSLISIENNTSRQIFSTTLNEDNGGVGGDAVPTDWKSRLRLKPGTGPYYDIQLERKGSYRGQEIDYRVVYHYDGIRYVSSTVDRVMQKE